MHPLERRVAERLPSDRPLVVACSGGSDSVALLLLAVAARPQVEVAHLDHGWRDESAADADFVEELCARLQVPCHRHRLIAGPAPNGREAEGRQARYSWLRSLGRTVMTAHTLDDQAETVLMRCLEGSGTAGLAGIRPRSWLLRPLLDVRKSELVAYLRERGQSWREDPTNDDRTRPRAWVRHELLPIMRERQSRVEEALARVAASAAEDESYLRERARRCDPADFLQLPPALASRVARQAWSDLAPVGARLGRLHIQQLHDLADRPGGGSLEMPGGVRVEKLGNRLHWSRLTEVAAVPREVPLAPRMELGPWQLESREEDPGENGWVSLPRDLVAPGGVLRFRGRDLGDRWGARKLKRQLQFWGIPPSQRLALWLLVTSENQVAWVVGQQEIPRGLPSGPPIWLRGVPR